LCLDPLRFSPCSDDLLPYPHPSSKGFVPEGASTLNRFDWSVNRYERERGEEKRREEKEKLMTGLWPAATSIHSDRLITQKHLDFIAASPTDYYVLTTDNTLIV